MKEISIGWVGYRGICIGLCWGTGEYRMLCWVSIELVIEYSIEGSIE